MNYEKENKTKKMDIKRAGVVAIFEDKFVLIKSTGKGKYVFPKGKIEINETTQIAAMREADEEAGIIGSIQKELCQVYDIIYFLVIVNRLKDDYDEKSTRSRKLFSFQEIMGSNNNVSEIAQQLAEYVKNST